MNIGRRIEQEMARLHLSFLMSKGVKDVDIYDLMMHEERYATDHEEDEEVDSLMVYMMSHAEEATA